MNSALKLHICRAGSDKNKYFVLILNFVENSFGPDFKKKFNILIVLKIYRFQWNIINQTCYLHKILFSDV